MLGAVSVSEPPAPVVMDTLAVSVIFVEAVSVTLAVESAEARVVSRI